MKRIICLILLIILSLMNFASCGGYDPVPSTEEEMQVVMTLALDGEEYEVKYELYRALFLTYKETVDGGDESVWSGDKKNEYIAAIHDMIVARITDIYATLHHAKAIGINMYSKSIDSKIEEYIKISIEGGTYGDETTPGYESYDAYLAALAKIGINYSVQELIFRYSIALDMIAEHYLGTPKEDLLGNVSYDGGALKYTREDVESFYFSDDSVRYISAFVQSEYANAKKRAEALHERMKEHEGDDKAVSIEIYSSSISSDADLNAGTVIGRYVLDGENYGGLTDAAFATPVGRVSDIVEATLGEAAGFFILYPIDKSSQHFESCYDYIAAVYAENEIGKLLTNTQNRLTQSAKATSVLESLDYSKIEHPTVNK